MHRTTIWEFLVVWGIFVFIGVTYLLVRLWNFPWRDSLVDLFGIVPASAGPIPSPRFPQQRRVNRAGAGRASSASRLRPATLRMSPAYCGGGLSRLDVCLLRSGPDDDAVATPTLEDAGQPNEDPNGVDPSLDA